MALAVVMLAMAASCGKQNTIEEEQGKEQTVPTTIVKFTAEGGALTRTTLAAGNKVEWLSGDAITVFDGSTPVESVTADEGASATFEASLATAGPWYALYPANASATKDGSNKITTTLPTAQSAVAGSFADDLNISIALSSESTLSFKNVLGLIKFTAGEANIKSVTLAGNNSEIVAGEVKINYNGGDPTWENVNGVTSITLSGSFVKGNAYYFAVLPQTFTNGFTLTYTSTADVETVHSTSNALNLGRSEIYDIGSPDIIVFADADVKSALIANVAGLDANSDGEISKTEAAALSGTALSSIAVNTLWGADLSVINSFDELKYFTGLTATPLFTGCSNLTSVTLPNSITSISNSSFKDCTSLVSVTQATPSVRQIFANAFAGCTSLVSISIFSNVTKLGGSAFDGCTALETVSDLGGTYASIEQYAFRNCNNLEGVHVSASLTTIAKQTFQYCHKLATFTDTGETNVFRIPEGVTIIDQYAFDNCRALPNPDFSRCTALATLGDRCFRGCQSFTAVDIPATVTSMKRCFAKGGRPMVLESITVRNTTPPTGTAVFESWSAPYPTIYVPSASVATYKGASIWSAYADYIFAIP